MQYRVFKQSTVILNLQTLKSQCELNCVKKIEDKSEEKEAVTPSPVPATVRLNFIAGPYSIISNKVR